MKCLIFNIDQGSIANYTVGELFETEMENAHPSVHAKEGFSIYEKDGMVAGITIFFKAGYLGHNNKVYQGRISYNNDEVDLSSTSTPEDIVNVFGIPSEQWNDGVEKCMIFMTEGKEIEFIWSVDKVNALEYISVSKD